MRCWKVFYMFLPLLGWGAVSPEAQVPHPLLERAERAWAQGRHEEARETLFRAMRVVEPGEARDAIVDRLGLMNLELLFLRQPQEESDWVVVRSGDTLGRIAARHGTTVELLRRSNQIRGDLVSVGQRLKVLQQPFTVEVSKSDNELTLFLGGRFFKRFPVSTGLTGNTPAGTFRITDRIVHPDWWHPETGRRIPFGHPDHRIGTHWLGWDRRGFGIHGTDEPERIGQSVSLGCVRMRNEDVAILYTLLPSGTVVTVRE